MSTPSGAPIPPDVKPVLTDDLKIGVFNVDKGAENEIAAAEQRKLNAEKTDVEAGFFKRTAKRIWNTSFERLNRERYRQEAQQQILESGNIYAMEEGNLSMAEEVNALTARAMSDYEDMVSAEAGERVEKVEDTPEGTALKDQVWDLLQDATEHNHDLETFNANATRLIYSVASGDSELLQEGVNFAHTLWEAKQTVQHALEHGDAIERIRQEVNLDLRVGDLTMGARTEMARDLSDKAFDKIKNGNARLMTATGVDTTKALLPLAATVGVIKEAGVKTARSAGLITGAATIFSAARGIYRERRQLKQERHMHMREKAQGKTSEAFPDPESIDASSLKGWLTKKAVQGAKERRDALEATAYETMSAAEQLEQMQSYLNDDGSLNVESGVDYMRILDEVALARAADSESTRRGVDLITYSSLDSIEQERSELMMARAEVQARLMDRFGDFAPDGFDVNEETFRKLLTAREEGIKWHTELEKGLKDEAFAKLRRGKSVAKSAIFSGSAALLLVGGAQELVGHAQDSDYADFTGPIDAFGEGGVTEEGDKETLLRSLFDEDLETQPVKIEVTDAAEAAEGSASDMESVSDIVEYTFASPVEGAETTTLGIGEFTEVTLPDGLHTEPIVGAEVEGSLHSIFTEVDGERTEIVQIELDQHGQITEGSLAELTEAGVVDSSRDVEAGALSGETQNFPLSEDQFVKLPKEYEVIPLENGQFEVRSGAGESLGALQLDEAGVLIDDRLGVMDGHVISAETFAVAAGTETVELSVAEYLDGADTTEVDRIGWWTQDTAESDYNELRVYAGGENGGWKDAEGRTRIDVSSMFEGGSFQDGDVLDLQARLDEGDLKAAITLDRDSQGEAILFDIEVQTDEAGNILYVQEGTTNIVSADTEGAVPMVQAVLDADHGANSLFSGEDFDSRQFSGGFVEIFEMTGEQNEAGAEEVRVLATFVGENNAETITETVSVSTDVTTVTIEAPAAPEFTEHTLTFGEVAEAAEGAADVAEGAVDAAEGAVDAAAEVAAAGAEVAADASDEISQGVEQAAQTEVVPEVIENREVLPVYAFGPVYARGGLARMSRAENAEHGREGGPEKASNRWNDRSDRLKEDPKAELGVANEVPWYMTLIGERLGGDYLDSVRADVASTQNKEAIDNDAALVVTLPVEASKSADTIYDAISLYANQSFDDASMSQSVSMFLGVNWTEAQMADPDMRAQIEKTQAEIQRAIADFPQLKVMISEKQWDAASAPIGVELEDLAVRHSYDTLMGVFEEAITSGRINPTFTDEGTEYPRDIGIMRTSMNVNGITRTFIQNAVEASYRRAARDGYEADIITGARRVQTEDYDDYPGLAAVANFAAVLDRLSTRRKSANVSTTNADATVMSAAAFAAVGGIGFNNEQIDDTEIGYRINAARDVRNPSPASLYDPETAPTGEETGSFGGRNPIIAGSGAQVDVTDTQFVAEYLERGSVADTADRTDSEDLRDENSVNLMIERYEQSVEHLLTDQYRDPATAQTALAMTIGAKDSTGNPNYELTWTDGRAEFKLTDSGRRFLRDTLLFRSSKDGRRGQGRIAPIGNRTRLNLYSIKKKGAKREAKRAVARMLRRGEHPDA